MIPLQQHQLSPNIDDPGQLMFEDGDEAVGFDRRQRYDEGFQVRKGELVGISKLERIKFVVSGIGCMFVVSWSNRLYRWRYAYQNQFKVIDIYNSASIKKQKMYNIYQIYLDEKGHHTIICQVDTYYYLHYMQTKPRCIISWKGLKIKGLDFIDEGEVWVRVVYFERGLGLQLMKLQLGRNQMEERMEGGGVEFLVSEQVTQIQYINIKQGKGELIVILMVVGRKLYMLSGCDGIHAVINRYKNNVDKIKCYSEMEIDRLDKSWGEHMMLKVGYRRGSNKAVNVILMSGGKCVLFVISGESGKMDVDSLFERGRQLRVGRNSDGGDGGGGMVDNPISVGINQYNYYLLYVNCVIITSLINSKTQHVIYFMKGQLMNDMVFDPKSYNFMLYLETDIYILGTQNTEYEAWQILLSDGRYHEAYCISKQTNINIVHSASLLSSYLFNNGQYTEAAKYYHETNISFEKVLLKFWQVDAVDGVILYLWLWLEKLGKKKRMQRSLIASLLVEVCCYQLVGLDREWNKYEMRDNKKRIEEKQQFLYKVIDDNIDVINSGLLYGIMRSYGRVHDIINFAYRKNDIQVIVEELILTENYEQVFRYLKEVNEEMNEGNYNGKKKREKQRRGDRNQRKEQKYVGNERINAVIYKYADIFFKYAAKDFVNLLTKSIQKFSSEEFCTSIMSIPNEDIGYGIELLKYCIVQLKTRIQVLHNILLYFYVLAGREQIFEVIELMQRNVLHIDWNFGLRLFSTYCIPQGQITIYGKLNEHNRAVDLALQNGLQQLAEYYANKVTEQRIRKQLLMKLVRYYFKQEEGKIERVMLIVKKSGGLIRIEDIVGDFSGCVDRMDFRLEICQSINDHNSIISDLNNTIKSYAQNAQQLKSELHSRKNQYNYINSNNKCQQCNKVLFNTDFYMFPCHHGFHHECLLEVVLGESVLGGDQVRRVRELEEEIKGRKGGMGKKQEGKCVQRGMNGQGVRNNSLIQKFVYQWIPQLFRGNALVQSAKNMWNSLRDEEMECLDSEREDIEMKRKINEIRQIIGSECIYCSRGVVDRIVMQFQNEELIQMWKL